MNPPGVFIGMLACPHLSVMRPAVCRVNVDLPGWEAHRACLLLLYFQPHSSSLNEESVQLFLYVVVNDLIKKECVCKALMAERMGIEPTCDR